MGLMATRRTGAMARLLEKARGDVFAVDCPSRSDLGSALLVSFLQFACAPVSQVASGASASATDKTAQSAADGSESSHNSRRGAADSPTLPRVADPEAVGVSLDQSHSDAPSFRLPLAEDRDFTRMRLPDRDVGRYQVWRQLTRIHVGQSHLTAAHFFEGERQVLVQSDVEGVARVYDVKTGRVVARHDFRVPEFEAGALVPWPTHAPGSLSAHDPMAPQFLYAKEDGLVLSDALSPGKTAQLSDAWIRLMRWSSDRSTLVALPRADASSASTLEFYERREQALHLLGKLHFTGRVDAWDLSRDNRLLAVAYYPSSRVQVFDLSTGQIVAAFPAQNYVASLMFSPNGRMLAVGGQGLLLVDLLNTNRRAYYSHYFNNINTVRFSPSGDALATSSYDGHIRIFSYESDGPSLRLMRTLRHEGRANVYNIEFSEDGSRLLSASGDQTVRIFGAGRPIPCRLPDQDEFNTLARWAELDPAALTDRTQVPPLPMKDGHYHPPLLDGPPRPTRIQEGDYACKITDIYRLRGCTVRKNSDGHTILEFHRDNLLGLSGVLYDDGPVTRYIAWLTDPSTVVGRSGCEAQPIHGILRGSGRNFRGLLTFQNYHDPFAPPPPPPADVVIEEGDDRFPLVLQFRSPQSRP